MSAFIVSPDTMRRCIAGIDMVRKELILSGTAPEIDKFWNEGGEKAVGEALFALNEAAVFERYGDARSQAPSYVHRKVRPTPIEAFKALSCLRYQCSEGNAPETQLYKELDLITMNLAEIIVKKLPAYEQAE